MFLKPRAGPLLAAGAIAGLAFATTQVSANTLNVSASVPADCTIQTGTLDFGQYNPAAPKDAAGSFTVTCTVNANVALGLNAGQNFDGTARQVKNQNDNFIYYLLYKEAGRTTEWGDGNGGPGTKRTVSIEGGSVPRTVDVFGRLLNAGLKPAGSYTDIVNITLDFD